MPKHIYFSLLVISLTIYAIRVMPFLFIRKPIKNRWFKSFLYYVPYVTLAVMTFPAILTASQTPYAGAVALAAGIAAAFLSEDLFITAITCCAAVFLTGLF
ncbi:MAG: AzlD domain-containing protein [Eubacteriales bacterium]|nr:AzlD domain-containing protein [Eubacteriales bacterium]